MPSFGALQLLNRNLLLTQDRNDSKATLLMGKQLASNSSIKAGFSCSPGHDDGGLKYLMNMTDQLETGNWYVPRPCSEQHTGCGLVCNNVVDYKALSTVYCNGLILKEFKNNFPPDI